MGQDKRGWGRVREGGTGERWWDKIREGETGQERVGQRKSGWNS